MDTIKRVAADQLMLVSIASVLLFLDGIRSICSSTETAGAC